ncbi:MAG: DUF3786 domain-containing protein [Nitrospirota bacterium]|jgi:hypothetical protein
MSGLSPLEIYKILPRTNCRQCQAATCMAFAAAVLRGQKRFADCPHLESGTIARLEGKTHKQSPAEKKREELLESLRGQIAALDFPSRAAHLGAETRDGKLVVKCLGREFEIDPRGNIESQCHTHVWFSIPLLHYVLFSQGREPSGAWVPFRLLKNGAAGSPLFEQRCEKPLKHIADTHTELFEYLVDVFGGTPSDNFDSDISVVLFPFPKVPLLICYWKSEGELESQLHLFFDSTAEENLGIETTGALGVGLANMLEKIILKHR